MLAGIATILAEIFRGSLQSLQAMSGQYLKLDHIRLLAHPFQLIVHDLWYYSTL